MIYYELETLREFAHLGEWVRAGGGCVLCNDWKKRLRLESAVS